MSKYVYFIGVLLLKFSSRLFVKLSFVFRPTDRQSAIAAREDWRDKKITTSKQSTYKVIISILMIIKTR